MHKQHTKYTVKAIPSEVLKSAYKEPSLDHVGGFKVLRQGKHTIFHPEIGHLDATHLKSFGIVSFPKETDRLAFRKASEGTKTLGPANMNPDAVGTVQIDIDPSGHFEIHSAQSHFMTEGNPRLKDASAGLKRGLATKYAGWRRRNLKVALDLAREKGTHMRIPESAFTRFVDDPAAKFNSGLRRDLEGLCEQEGLKLQHIGRRRSEGGYFYVIDPQLKAD